MPSQRRRTGHRPASCISYSLFRGAMRALAGRSLETGTGAAFVVDLVDVDRVVVVPASTGKGRPIRWAELNGAWELLQAQ